MKNNNPVDRSQDQVPLTHVAITNRNSSFFGKIFKILKADLEHVVAEVEVEGEKFIHIFNSAEVNKVPDPATVPVQAAPVAGDSAPTA